MPTTSLAIQAELVDSAVAREIASTFPALTGLSLSGASLDTLQAATDALSILLSSISTISASDDSITAQARSPVQSLQRLTALTIRDASGLPPALGPALCSWSALRTLQLNYYDPFLFGSDMNEQEEIQFRADRQAARRADAALLASLTQLRSLALDDYIPHTLPAMLRPLTRLTRLALEYDAEHAGDDSDGRGRDGMALLRPRVFACLPRLRELDLGCRRLCASGLHTLAQLTYLQAGPLVLPGSQYDTSGWEEKDDDDGDLGERGQEEEEEEEAGTHVGTGRPSQGPANCSRGAVPMPPKLRRLALYGRTCSVGVLGSLVVPASLEAVGQVRVFDGFEDSGVDLLLECSGPGDVSYVKLHQAGLGEPCTGELLPAGEAALRNAITFLSRWSPPMHCVHVDGSKAVEGYGHEGLWPAAGWTGADGPGHGAWLRGLAALPSLSSLVLSGFYMRTADVVGLAEACPCLTALDVRDAKLAPEALLHLSRLASLTRLSLDAWRWRIADGTAPPDTPCAMDPAASEHLFALCAAARALQRVHLRCEASLPEEWRGEEEEEFEELVEGVQRRLAAAGLDPDVVELW